LLARYVSILESPSWAKKCGERSRPCSEEEAVLLDCSHGRWILPQLTTQVTTSDLCIEAWSKPTSSGERLYRYRNTTFTDASWQVGSQVNERNADRGQRSTATTLHGLSCSWQPSCHPFRPRPSPSPSPSHRSLSLRPLQQRVPEPGPGGGMGRGAASQPFRTPAPMGRESRQRWRWRSRAGRSAWDSTVNSRPRAPPDAAVSVLLPGSGAASNTGACPERPGAAAPHSQLRWGAGDWRWQTLALAPIIHGNLLILPYQSHCSRLP
jgi:hypothetical protein